MSNTDSLRSLSVAVPTALLALRRKYSLMKMNATKPSSLFPLSKAVTSAIEHEKEALRLRAEKYKEEVMLASAADLPPPLVYHDESLSLLATRIQLWEKLQRSVACISEM